VDVLFRHRFGGEVSKVAISFNDRGNLVAHAGFLQGGQDVTWARHVSLCLRTARAGMHGLSVAIIQVPDTVTVVS
jgi:hypothetical protein